jgi:carboxyl-terminal processing protease
MLTDKKVGILKNRGLFALLTLLLTTLACQAVTGALAPSTTVPTATSTAPAPSATALPRESPTVVPEFNDAGVRYCYYVPGVSVPAEMPAEVLATPTPFVYPTITPPSSTTVDAATSERQLKIFQELWTDVRDNYVYTDFNGHDWDAIGDKYEALVKGGLSDEDFYLAMDEMIFELGDEHSRFLAPEQVKAEEQEMAGQQNFVGIGALVMQLEGGASGTIVSVFPGSPAAQAGLRLHDKVLGVDGGPWLDETTGQSRTLGPEGTPVTVTIQRPGEDPRDVTMTRGAISSSLPIDYCIVPGTRIGYVYLPSFFDTTIDEQVHDALEKMTADGPLDGLILDNRMNSGGLNTVAEPILSYFTGGVSGHFVSREDTRPLELKPEDINGSQTVPLAVLVDLGTASYGEIFSGVLRVANRATILGQNTLGNVEVLHGFDFEDGSMAWIAAETFEPVGEANGIWERTGIVPDFLVPTRWDLFTEANDPALARAVDLLLNK